MRFLFTFILLGALMCLSMAEVDDQYLEVVERAIQMATQAYDKSLYNATVNGAQSIRKRRGTKTTPETEEMGRMAAIQMDAFEILTKEHNLDRNTALRQIRQATPAACAQPSFTCQPNSKYRNQDGTCNNLNNPRWGASPSAMRRVVTPAYNDGSDEPRGGRAQTRLASPRLISTVLHPDSNTPNPTVTNMVPAFGQFLDHDLTLTPEASLQCCSGQSNSRDCWPISIPNNDNFFSSFRETCMDFTRSTPWCFATSSGVREQINMNTAYIDGSHIYGSSLDRTRNLRSFTGGRLKTNTQLNGFLPTSTNVNAQVQGTFIAGDDRINENPTLAVLHNLFLMEHNRIAGLIQGITGWSDETIFQETRRIVIAEFQQVTYNEYLPIILGDAAMRSSNLYLGNSFSTYNSSQDASIFNSFATAAYRFGHTLINGLIRLISNTNAVVGSFNIRDNYFQSNQITQSSGQGYDWIMRGLMRQNSQEFDPFVSADVTNFLFKPQNQNFGADLVARNIQRGRDHGLPPYNTFRSACGLPTITSWNSRPSDVRADSFSRAPQVYATPNDIDLFSGALMENVVTGGLSGPTFNCLKSLQFARLKFGDRFFFTHGGQAGSFSGTAMTELRRRTLGDIICQNSRQPSTTRNVFLIPSSSNLDVSCSDASRTLDVRALLS